MKISYYHIDAFSDELFRGNPAGVCPLETWLPDKVMQAIAYENHLSETSFFVATAPQHFHLRWFAPDKEMDLCGHATLASAFCLFHHLNYQYDTVYFDTLSGVLKVTRENDLICLDFPARIASCCIPTTRLAEIFELNLVDCLKYYNKYIIVTDDINKVHTLDVNHILKNKQLLPETVIITAADTTNDFICRYFKPHDSITEDPVTGSACCILAPYWADKLGKKTLRAYQASPRGGNVLCKVKGDRVLLKGSATCYLQGEIILADHLVELEENKYE